MCKGEACLQRGDASLLLTYTSSCSLKRSISCSSSCDRPSCTGLRAGGFFLLAPRCPSWRLVLAVHTASSPDPAHALELRAAFAWKALLCTGSRPFLLCPPFFPHAHLHVVCDSIRPLRYKSASISLFQQFPAVQEVWSQPQCQTGTNANA